LFASRRSCVPAFGTCRSGFIREWLEPGSGLVAPAHPCAPRHKYIHVHKAPPTNNLLLRGRLFFIKCGQTRVLGRSVRIRKLRQ